MADLTHRLPFSITVTSSTFLDHDDSAVLLCCCVVKEEEETAQGHLGSCLLLPSSSHHRISSHHITSARVAAVQYMFTPPSILFRPQFELRKTIVNSLIPQSPFSIAPAPMNQDEQATTTTSTASTAASLLPPGLEHMIDDMQQSVIEQQPSSCYVLQLLDVPSAGVWAAVSGADVVKLYDSDTGLLRSTLAVRVPSSALI
jgi:hypothetical protein